VFLLVVLTDKIKSIEVFVPVMWHMMYF
jgi:hypothetical protein